MPFLPLVHLGCAGVGFRSKFGLLLMVPQTSPDQESKAEEGQAKPTCPHVCQVHAPYLFHLQLPPALQPRYSLVRDYVKTGMHLDFVH